MIKTKRKKCKECGKLFKPFRTTQIVCSSTCAYKYIKRKKEEDAKKVEGWIKEKKESNKLSTHLNYTKEVVHKYIRDRDKGKPCISCGCQWNNDFEAGHFYSANQFTAIKFDVFNINGQCIKCNRFGEGMFAEYSLNLPNRIGIEQYNKLVKRAELNKRFTKKWTRTELKQIQKEIKTLQNDTNN